MITQLIVTGFSHDHAWGKMDRMIHEQGWGILNMEELLEGYHGIKMAHTSETTPGTIFYVPADVVHRPTSNTWEVKVKHDWSAPK